MPIPKRSNPWGKKTSDDVSDELEGMSGTDDIASALRANRDATGSRPSAGVKGRARSPDQTRSSTSLPSTSDVKTGVYFHEFLIFLKIIL